MDADAIRRLWDGEYSAGGWSHLRERMDSLDRLQIVAGWINHSGGAQRVLDVGCGEGQLLKCLDKGVVRSYLGVDVSKVALSNPLYRPGIDAEYRVLEVQSEDLPAEMLFDCICLIDVPYYFDRPEAAFDRLFRHLAPGGFVIVCMWVDRRLIEWRRRFKLWVPGRSRHNRSAARVWNYIGRHTAELIDAVELRNVRTGDVSKFRVFRPSVEAKPTPLQNARARVTAGRV